MRWYEDTEYQLMCEKAEEIHKERIRRGDFYLLHNQLHLWSDIEEIDPGQGRMKTDLTPLCRIKLHSQEDLQEIYERYLQKRCDIGEYGFNVAYTFTVLEEFLKTFFHLTTAGRIKEGWYPKSWVQLWLAFVYHELYDKKWNPKKKEWEEE